MRFVILVLACAMAACTADDARRSAPRQGQAATTAVSTPTSPGGSITTTTATARPGSADTTTTSTAPRVPSPSPPPACRRGGNGGAVERGVTADRIRIVATTVFDGPEKGYAEGVAPAVKSVTDAVNRGGGICGRLVDVRMVGRASQAMYKEAAAHAFAMLPTTLDGGFEAALRAGVVDRGSLPTIVIGDVGAPASPWVWELGPTPAAVTRIALDHPYRHHAARTFALVHDATNSFGTEAADAFRRYAARLPGATVRTVQALRSDESRLTHQAAAFDDACRNDACDVVVLAVLPQTAAKWWGATTARPRLHYAGLPQLLTERFAKPCATDAIGTCPRLRVWTGVWPLSDKTPYATEARVVATVLIDALRRTGPALTRGRFRRVLDTETFTPPAAHRVTWSPRQRAAIKHAQAVVPGTDGWQTADTGWVGDPG